jgi:hypothetical protein
MRKVGWVLGVAASILLGPVVYLLARVVEVVAPPPVLAPVVLPITSRARRR